MAVNDDVLIRLVIKGLDPSEVTRLANQTGGQLAAEMGKHFVKLTELHALSKQKLEAEERKSVNEQIKEHQKLLDAAKKVYNSVEKEATKAANESMNAWRRAMNDLKNIVVVGAGAVTFWQNVIGKAKDLGDESARLTNIYGSLKGSIDEMVRATDGQISNTDLILTKNRAVEKELQLTDQQLGAVAAQADRFADALGINTKDALDKLIDGLASGRTKMLAAAGVIVDNQEAYREYAKKIGIAVDRLTDHEKKLATVEASLKAMDKKLVESGGGVKNFADDWEKTAAQLQNVWDKMLLSLGKFVQEFKFGITHGIPVAMAQLKDLLHDYTPIGFAQDMVGGKRKQSYESEVIARLKASDKAEADAAAAKVAAAQARLNDPNAYTQPRDAAAEDRNRPVDKKAVSERERLQKEAEKTFGIMFGHKKGTFDTQGFDSSFTQFPNLAEMGIANDVSLSGGALAADKNAELDRLMGGAGASLQALMDELDDKVVKPLQAKVTASEEDLKATNEAAGGGIMARLLFGPDGPTESLKMMDEFGKASVDSMGMVADAGMAMADALGKSLVATIAGGKGAKASIRDVTHAILEGLAAQAFAKAIFNTAEGFAALALGPIGGVSAAGFFKAAALYGAVGVAAGLGARGVGQSAGDSGGIGAASSAGSGGFGSSSGFRSANDNSGRPIVINVNGAIPGTEAEVGRAIWKTLKAHSAESGEPIGDASMTGT